MKQLPFAKAFINFDKQFFPIYICKIAVSNHGYFFLPVWEAPGIGLRGLPTQAVFNTLVLTLLCLCSDR